MTNHSSLLDTPEGRALAREALDLWQEHLAFYATDPRAKDDLARLVEPLAKVFAESGLGGALGGVGATPAAAGKPEPAFAARMDALARRMAQVEKTLAALEGLLAAAPSHAPPRPTPKRAKAKASAKPLASRRKGA